MEQSPLFSLVHNSPTKHKVVVLIPPIKVPLELYNEIKEILLSIINNHENPENFFLLEGTESMQNFMIKFPCIRNTNNLGSFSSHDKELSYMLHTMINSSYESTRPHIIHEDCVGMVSTNCDINKIFRLNINPKSLYVVFLYATKLDLNPIEESKSNVIYNFFEILQENEGYYHNSSL
jgi:hypothetical protein